LLKQNEVKISGMLMCTTLTVKGQVTIPKPNRDAMGLTPGAAIDVAVNRNVEVVLHKADSGHASRKSRPQPDRFEAACGKADVPWKTQDLMALLRG
jgi:AbrB family looped-hinge helix DNA binding protein